MLSLRVAAAAKQSIYLPKGAKRALELKLVHRRVATFAILALLALASSASAKVEAYVWQRQPGPAVASAMEQFAQSLDGFCVLAGEITWPAGRLELARPALNFARLAQLGRPIGLALRVNAHPRLLDANGPDLAALAGVVSALLKQARAGGLEPAELQVDFDCPESKLTRYRECLEGLRPAVGQTPLVFTALPTWLKHAAFADLARAADGFVLQVHSLERPARFEQAIALCDPSRARGWIEQASRIGMPFRVALPTHGYLLGFDDSGNYLGVAAEGPRPTWPRGTRTRAVLADAPAMAKFSREIVASAPANFTGLVWFRLPVTGDRWGWDALTFATVLRGEIPVSRLQAKAKWVEPGLAEIILDNAGEIPELTNVRVEVRWADAEKLQASDGLGGFQLEFSAQQVQAMTIAAGKSTSTVLAPGRQVKIAWLRFAHDTPLDVSFSPPR